MRDMATAPHLRLNPATLLLLPHVMKRPLIIDRTPCTVKLEEMSMVLLLFHLSLNITENCLSAKNAVHYLTVNQH